MAQRTFVRDFMLMAGNMRLLATSAAASVVSDAREQREWARVHRGEVQGARAESLIP
jgi:hypothetical protein